MPRHTDNHWLEVIATGGASGGGPATIANGADVAEGLTTDAVVAAGAAGTVSAKLRRLTTDLDTIKTSMATTSTTGTQSIVASSASSVTILASNTSRKGATVFNDSTQILYLILSSTTASATVYSVQLAANAYYEVPFRYTGQLTGIWASANGNARVTELT